MLESLKLGKHTRMWEVQMDGEVIDPRACTCECGDRLTCPLDDHRAKYLQETSDWKAEKGK